MLFFIHMHTCMNFNVKIIFVFPLYYGYFNYYCNGKIGKLTLKCLEKTDGYDYGVTVTGPLCCALSADVRLTTNGSHFQKKGKAAFSYLRRTHNVTTMWKNISFVVVFVRRHIPTTTCCSLLCSVFK